MRSEISMFPGRACLKSVSLFSYDSYYTQYLPLLQPEGLTRRSKISPSCCFSMIFLFVCQASWSCPPSSPTIVGRAVATIVCDNAATSIPSINPTSTVTICRWVRCGISGWVPITPGRCRERFASTVLRLRPRGPCLLHRPLSV